MAELDQLAYLRERQKLQRALANAARDKAIKDFHDSLAKHYETLIEDVMQICEPYQRTAQS